MEMDSQVLDTFCRQLADALAIQMQGELDAWRSWLRQTWHQIEQWCKEDSHRSDGEDAVEAARMAVDVCWEEMNAVPYHAVSKQWRVWYTLTSAMLAWILVSQCCLATQQKDGPTPSLLARHKDRLVEASHALDKALIIAGAPVLSPAIHALIDWLQRALSSADPSTVSEEPSWTPTQSKMPTVTCPVTVMNAEDLSCMDFQRLVLDPSQHHPILIRNALNHWPALSTTDPDRAWTIENLLQKIAGHRLVPVEVGANYMAADWGQSLMPFEQFYSRHLLRSHEFGVAYLAQHNLLHQVPSLLDDISIPDYCLAALSPALSSPIVNTWLGPNGTVSPAHTDPYHNLFAQVIGCKYVRLFAPDQSRFLYPHGSESLLTNTSQISNVEDWDEEQFPLLGQASYQDCIVIAGDLLYGFHYSCDHS